MNRKRFGGSASSSPVGPASRANPAVQASRIVDAYADAGGNVIDTAIFYGESEQMLGELLAGRRDRFVLASKYTPPAT